MKVMFLDESGDHNLTVIDPTYPLFVLGGVIADVEYAKTVMQDAVAQFKLDMFGRTDLVLHTADISRNRNGFEALKDTAFRERFYHGLNRLMENLDYQVVACAIRKPQHLARYETTAVDPYHLSLQILVERFCFEIGPVSGGGAIVAEARGSQLDHQLELAWLDLKIRGTRFLPGRKINDRVRTLVLRSKARGIAGLELADLVVSPIGRHLLGKRDNDDYRIVERKFRRVGGTHEGSGLVVLPRE